MVYKIIEKDNTRRLTEEVNEHLEDGWELQGGVSTLETSGIIRNIYYLQSLKKNI